MKDGKHLILCIDDDPDVLLSIRTVLEANDYILVEADSGETGIARFKEVNPDLVIADLMMEEVDAGRTLVKEIRMENKDVPIYMLSSVGDALNSSTDYADLGLDGIFQKPVDPNTLLATLKLKLAR